MSLIKIFVNNQDTGFDGNVYQEIGKSTTAPMSQKAITDIVTDTSVGELILPNEILPGFLNVEGKYSTSNTGNTRKYLTSDISGDYVYITGRSRGTESPFLPAASFLDINDNVIEVFGTDGRKYIDEKVMIPEGTSYFYVTNGSNEITLCKEALEVEKYATNIRVSSEESLRQQGDVSTYIQAKDYTDYRTLIESYEQSLPSSSFQYDDYYLEPSQTIGGQIAFGQFSNHYKKEIPEDTTIKFTVTPGGAYGYVLTDLENNVISYSNNSGISEDIEIVFLPQRFKTILWISDAHIIFPINTVSNIPVINLALDLDNRISSEELARQQGDASTLLQAKEYVNDQAIIEHIRQIPSSLFESGDYYLEAWQTIGLQIVFGTHSNHLKKQIEANTTIKFTITPGGAYGFVLTDLLNNVLDYVNNYNITENVEKEFLPRDVETILWLSSPHIVFPVTLMTYNSVKDVVEEQEEEIIDLRSDVDALKQDSQNYWKQKKIWWCGTSIPAGSDATIGSDETIAGNYPKHVGTILQATVYNKSVGGGMCRCNVRTGDYNGANISNITGSLSMTLQEVESFILNYDTLRQLPGNRSWPQSLSEGEKNRMRSSSFENALLPYLNGTYDMPNLFVIDHGHNDWKYSNSLGASDITLYPSLANIQSGELAEDTHMLNRMTEFFGSISNLPSSKALQVLASINRNCYIGAVNFIIQLIWYHNPKASIMLVTNYEYEHGASKNYSPLILAQKQLAEEWALPLCNVYEKLGFSDKVLINSKEHFNTLYPNNTQSTDVTAYRMALPDGVHPHSDTTGKSNNKYAAVLANFILGLR